MHHKTRCRQVLQQAAVADLGSRRQVAAADELDLPQGWDGLSCQIDPNCRQLGIAQRCRSSITRCASRTWAGPSSRLLNTWRITPLGSTT